MAALPERGPAAPDELTQIVAAAYPVVLRAQVAAWPAVDAARTGVLSGYLRGFASSQPVPCAVGHPSIGGRFFYRSDFAGMNFGRREAPLAELLDQLDATAPLALAMQSAPVDTVLPGFAEANPFPLIGDRARPRIWIGNQVRVATHYDSHDNLACVVGGRRRFTLFPPEQAANLYPGPLEMTPAGTPVSMVDPDAPDLARYPRFVEAQDAALTAELSPGDAIFIPYLWWHAVESRDPLSVLVNYWWSDAAEPFLPADTLLHALATFRNLPDSRRRAWRALFATLVFDDDAGVHLPDHARGVYAPRDKAELAAIAQHLAQRLNERS